jgi:hypothetical protein
MSKCPVFVLALALLVTSAALRSQEALPDFSKKVPRTDKAEVSVVGTVSSVGEIELLEDGTRFRIVEVATAQPLSPVIPVVCMGSTLTACGRLVPNRRVSVKGDFIVDPFGLGTVIAKSLPRAVPRADKAEAVVIGVVSFVDGVDRLTDGTPIRQIGIQSAKPRPQRIGIFCVGAEAAEACGVFVLGQRLSLTGDVRLNPDSTAWIAAKGL